LDNDRLRSLLKEATTGDPSISPDSVLANLARQTAQLPIANALLNQSAFDLEAMEKRLSIFRSVVPAYDNAARVLGLRNLDHLALWSVYLPLAEHIIRARKNTARCFTVVITGAPGAGKSTLAHVVELVLVEGFGVETLKIGSDDLYLPRTEKLALGQRWRGPSTIDRSFASNLFRSLREGVEDLDVPRYDSMKDDRRCVEKIHGAPSFCLFEGWLAGRIASDLSDSLGEPLIDLLIFLDIDLEVAKAARFRREEQARRLSRHTEGISRHDMDSFWNESIEPGIAQHTLPFLSRADLIIEIDRIHRPQAVTVSSADRRSSASPQ